PLLAGHERQRPAKRRPRRQSLARHGGRPCRHGLPAVPELQPIPPPPPLRLRPRHPRLARPTPPPPVGVRDAAGGNPHPHPTPLPHPPRPRSPNSRTYMTASPPQPPADATATPSQVGNFIICVAMLMGLVGALISVASYFATRREVDDLKDRVGTIEHLL